jgi:hypothetical protein
MSFPKQVWHVLSKDLRAQRWWLLLYVVLLGLGAAPAWGLEVFPRLTSFASFLFIIGTISTASIAFHGAFRADAPHGRSQAWVTLPLAPSAVFAAKLAFVLVLALVLPVAVYTAGWRHLGLPWSDMLSAWWPGGFAIVSILLVVAVFAAVMRSGAAVAATIALLATAGNALVQALVARFGLLLPAVPAVVGGLLVVMILLALLFRAFQRHAATSRRRAALLATGVFAILLPSRVARSNAGSTPLSSAYPIAALEVREARIISVRGDSSVALTISIAGIPSERVLSGWWATRDGCGSQHTQRTGATTRPHAAPRSALLPSGLRWRSESLGLTELWPTDEPVEVRSMVPIGAPSTRCAAAARHLLELADESLIAVVPAAEGSVVRQHGRRFEVRWPNDVRGQLAFALHETRAAQHETSAQREVMRPSRQLRVVFVNLARQEATAFSALHLHASNLEGNSLWLNSASYHSLRLQNSDGSGTPTWQALHFASDAEARAWLAEAQVYLIERHLHTVDITPEIERAVSPYRSVP